MSHTEKPKAKKVKVTTPEHPILTKAKKILGKKRKITATEKIGREEVMKAVKILKKNDKPLTPTHAEVKQDQKSVDLERSQFDERPFKFTNNAGVTKQLTAKQYKFCIIYLEERGNAVEAVIEAGYNVDYPNSSTPNRKLAAQIGYENLMKPDICEFISLKLAEYGFSDDNVELQHLFVMNQNGDMAAKMSAIDKFYKLKDRYPKQKLEVAHTFDSVEILRFAPKEKG